MGGRKKREQDKSNLVMVKVEKLLAETQGLLDSGIKRIGEQYDRKIGKTVVVFEVSKKEGRSLVKNNNAVYV